MMNQTVYAKDPLLKDLSLQKKSLMKSNDDDIHLSHAYDLLTQVTEK